jgi:hypothetical protein
MYARSAVPADLAGVRADGATEPQINFILDLLDQRDLFASPKWFDAVNAMDKEEYAAHLALTKANVPNMTKSQASRMIEELTKLPRLYARPKAEVKMGSNETQPDVPAGRYALEDPSDPLNPIKFYKVSHGKGKWAGFIFVDRFVSDDLFPVKGSARMKVLDQIAASPLEAAQRFGREENACCICGRRLTRRLSRYLGIGPVCGGRNEWVDSDMIASAREELRAQGLDPDEEVSV